MARDGSNVYHVPPGTPGSPGTPVESAKYNAYIADVEADLNLPRPIVAGGTGAASADAALTALSAEKAGQIVTNYNSHVFKAGSFYSAAGATGAQNATNAFRGICIITDANNMNLEARDVVTGYNYARYKTAGVWGAWSLDGGTNTFVLKSGDTMAGRLTIDPDADDTLLRMVHSSGSTYLFNLSTTPGSYSGIFTLDAVGMKIGVNTGSRDLEFQTNSTTRMFIGGTGLIKVGDNAAGTSDLFGLSLVGAGNATLGFYQGGVGQWSWGMVSGSNTMRLRDGGLAGTDRLSIAASTGDATFSGKVLATSKGNHFGSATGTIATGAVALADANVILYNNAATNWAGIGSDTGGNMWFKTGTAGTPVPAMYIGASNQIVNITAGISVPTPAAADNSTKAATTEWVRDYAQPLDAQLFAGIPMTAAVGYTTVLTDAQKCMRGTGAQTINAALAYPIGTVMTFAAYGGSMTIALSSGSLYWWNGTTTATGTRTLAGTGAIATVVKVAASEWMISGSGIS